ncbi:MAG: GNAT family N-acetyltransferase [Chloroflexi bacterium]|nr:GNAT family N-acetyltransferase [Chloroflexota bacterium]
MKEQSEVRSQKPEVSKVEHHRDAAIFDRLAPEWNDLVGRSLTNTPFQRAEFLAAWWRHFGHGDLCVLAMRDGAGSLIAIAPLFVDPAEGGVVRWVGGEEIADYLDVIAPDDLMESATRAMWQWLNSPEAPAWKRLILSNTPEWTPTLRRLQAFATESGMSAEVTRLDVCPVIQLPRTFDAYLKQLDSKQRHEINRKLRKAQGSEDAVTWHVVDGGRDIAAEAEAFMALMETASADKAAFLTPRMRAAFRDIFAAMHRARLLQLAFLEVGGVKAAAYAQFNYANRIWVYNSGINPAIAGQLSPGWILLARLIEDAINTGHAVYDFMQGNEDYKYRFGGKETFVNRLVVEKQL